MLEFNTEKKIVLENEEGELESFSYEELRKEVSKSIQEIEGDKLKKYYEEKYANNEISVIYEFFEIEKNYSVDYDTGYSNIREFAEEQKLLKLFNDILDESVKSRIMKMAQDAERTNLSALLRDTVNECLKFSFDSNELLEDGSVHNIEDFSIIIKEDYDFHKHLDDLRYPREVEWKIKSGKFSYTDNEINDIKKKIEDGGRNQVLLELIYYSNGEVVGNGTVGLYMGYEKAEFMCDCYGVRQDDLLYADEMTNSKNFPQTFSVALNHLQVFAEEGMAISIFREDENQTDVHNTTFIKEGFSSYREQILSMNNQAVDSLKDLNIEENSSQENQRQRQ